MPVRVLSVINYFLPVVLILGLLSCSKNEQSASVVFNSFFFFPDKDSSHIQASDHRIFVRVPENIISGTLVAEYSLSRDAGVYVNGVPQQSGITVNNFEHDVNYSINGSRVQELWTVQASNNDYSIPWGLGHFVEASVSNDRNYDWYIDQGVSGEFATVNCGPASVTMAIRWADSGFSKTSQEARLTYHPEGGWWYTSDINGYLNKYSVNHAIINLSGHEDSTRNILTRQLDRHRLVILCVDMNYIQASADPEGRVDKFYQTNPGWGHFIVLKGYRNVDEEVFFDVYDPYSLGLQYKDHTLKGMNRYYRNRNLAAACQSWWNYAFIIAGKGENLDPETLKKKLNPAFVPLAHNF